MQRIEALLPERSVTREPVIDLGQRLGPQAVHPSLRVLAHIDQPSLTEHPQVPRDSWASDGQQTSQLAGAGLSFAQSLQNPPSAGIGERMQQSIHTPNVPNRVCNRQVTETLQANAGRVT